MTSQDLFSLNHFLTVGKIVTNAPLEVRIKNLYVLTVPVQIPQPSSKAHRFVYLTLWDHLAISFKNYYNVNDYILIEGHLSVEEMYFTDGSRTEDVVLTAEKIYPFNLDALY